MLAARRTRTLRRLAEIASVSRTEADALALSMAGPPGECGRRVVARCTRSWATRGPAPAGVGGRWSGPRSAGALAPVLAACAGRVRESRIAEDSPSSGGDVAGPRGWMMSIGKSRLGAPAASLVLGRSPMVAFDEPYRTFFELVGAALAASLADRARFRGGEPAGRVAGRARPGEDHLLLQHQPRVPHPAHPPARTPGRARLADPRRGWQLALMRRNALRLQRLVNALLEFSRLEAGRANAISCRPTSPAHP